ncbi:NUDIX domain-containing protein [Bacillus timonensis]|nr:NUDIX domain-containing protein [Bacillus timonensis]
MYIVNVEAAIFRGDKWLIIERSKKEEHAGGLLSLVGGTVENEGFSSSVLEKTIKREIFEEVGVIVRDDMYYVRNTTFVTDNGELVLDIVFLCEIEEGEPFVKSPNEIESVHWMTLDEVLEHDNSPIWLKDSLGDAMKWKKS